MNKLTPYVKDLLSQPQHLQEFRELLTIVMEENMVKYHELTCCNYDVVSSYLLAKYDNLKNERFGVMFLDNAHNLIKTEILFEGTTNQASVYPRVIIEKLLKHGAQAVILFHNHPSGNLTPSESDKRTTVKIHKALQTVDAKLLDHFIIGNGETTSFAQRGIL